MFHEFLRIVRTGVENLPENSEITRKQFYVSLREGLDRHTSTNPDAIKHKLELDAAIASIEASFAPPATAFSVPDETPKSPWHYALIKVLLGCGAFGAIVDILKPIANIEMAVATLCVLGVIFLTALMRAMPARRGLLNGFRTFCAGTVAVLVGLFGIGVILPDGAPNGVVAQAIPPVMELQQLISDLRAPIEQTAHNTGILVQQATGTNERLDRLTDASDPMEQSRQYLERRGYSSDDQGYIRAIIDGDDNAISAFTTLGMMLNAENLRAALLAVSTSPDRLRSLFFFMDYGATSEARAAVRNDVHALADTVQIDFGMNSLRNAICGDADTLALAVWLRSILETDCEDETRWYVGASDRISAILKHFDVDWTERAYVVQSEVLQPTALFDKAVTGLFRVRALMTVDSSEDSDFYSDDFSEVINLNYRGLNTELDCVASPCWAEIHLLRDPQAGLRVLHIADVERGPFPTPTEMAESSTSSYEWSIGFMRSWGLFGVDRMMFLAAYDPVNRTGVGLFCSPGGRADTSATLRFAQNIDASQFSEILFHVGSDGPKADNVRFSFSGGVTFNGTTNAPGTRLRTINVNDDFIDQMVRGNTLRITTNDRGTSEIRLQGFTRALETFRQYSRCAQ